MPNGTITIYQVKRKQLEQMFNKESCKACGTYLTPTSVCSVCKEYVSWLCNKCERMEDVTHSHGHYRDAAYI